MLKIRLKRIGRKNRPFFRIVVTEASTGPKGKSIEILGHFNPVAKKDSTVLNIERIKYWIGTGAKASPVVYNLLVDHGVISGPKKKATCTHKKKEKEAKDAPVADASAKEDQTGHAEK